MTVVLRKNHFGWWILALLLAACAGSGDHLVDEAMEVLPTQLDYNFHVKPILSDRCFKCHGPDENQRKGDFRLDIEDDAYKKATNESSVKDYTIRRGKPYQSELIARILASDPNYMMPPPESHLTLNTQEKAILIRWIEEGAEYKPHWSFTAPALVKPPDLEHAYIRNDIDRFVLQKIQAAGYQPSPAADKATILRRATLDLTGLPPTQEEMLAFLEDQSADAYERAIDRLLQSPHYGEKLALEWLDLARYADSHGYQDDGMRNTWPWRDWIIEAYNRDLPFDTFLLWQLAGDLLPQPSKEQLIATCFNRNHPQTQEGGVIDEEYRVEYVADRTNTLGKAVLGLTMECARCHDHKYDPISMQDYYSLFAYFNNNNDAGIVPYNGEAAPTLILTSEEAEVKLQDLQSRISAMEAKVAPEKFVDQFKAWYEALPNTEVSLSKRDLLAEFHFEREVSIVDRDLYLDQSARPKEYPRSQEKRTTYAYHNAAKQRLDAKVWGHIDDRPTLTEGYHGQGLLFGGDAGVRMNRDLDFDRHQPFSVTLWVKPLRQNLEGPIFGNTNGDFEGYRGWLCKLNEDGTLSIQLNHVWPDNCIDLQIDEKLPVGEWTHLAMTYDGSSRAAGVKFFFNGKEKQGILFKDNLKKSILHGTEGSNWSDQPFLLGMELRKSIEDMVMDELMVYQRTLAPIEVMAIKNDLDHIDLDQLSDTARLAYFLLSKREQEHNVFMSKLTDLRQEMNLLLTDQPEIMIMQQRTMPRPTYVLDRGAYDAPAQMVSPAVPQQLSIEGLEFDQDRLGLAKWVIHPKHPLTARVAVNRLWQMCFGRGLVATQEDFGTQGNLPSHPELLDWLALRFVALDWSTKQLLKEILMSGTYRQSARVRKETLEDDPENMLYSYYPAHRLSAEIIRDQALAASGLLTRKIGGPSVYPYQPQGIWKALATRNATEYVQQHGENLYRRSMYTVWKRSSPPPAMMNFDAPDRYYCVVRRQNTATPLQSFVLMNDPQFVEAARVLAEQLVDDLDEVEDRVRVACRKLLARNPRADELNALTALYHLSLDKFKEQPNGAREILEVGEYAKRSNLDSIEVAATTIVVSTLMNHDEFVMKR